MSSKLSSKHARVIPNHESIAFHIARNQKYGIDKFESYNDWFYFIHVDPFTRYLHAFGMVIGSFFFLIMFIKWYVFGFGTEVIINYLIAVFFFYFLPLISHYIYDRGTAKSSPGRFHSTLIPVIHINYLTITGRYDKWLRKFIEKYPFVTEAWDLEDKAD